MSLQLPQMWHAYAAVLRQGTYSGAWVMITLGPTDRSAQPSTPFDGESLHHLATWHHEPTDEDKLAVTPEKFRDDDE